MIMLAYLHFADISHHNNDRGAIDWKQLSSYDGFMIKLTEGTTFVDPKGKENVKNAKKIGKQVGGYHYARFNDIATAKKEADFFLSVAKGLDLDYVALDVEHSNAKGDLTEASLAFLDKVNHIGKTLFYSYPYFIQQHFNKKITKYPLWIANYGVKQPEVPLWNDWSMWQYSPSGRAKGVSGNLDLDYMKPEFAVKQNGKPTNPTPSPPSPPKKPKPPKKPSPTYFTYKVKKGDTLSELAAKYHTTVDELVKLNHIKNANLIYIGQTLKIPSNNVNKKYPGHLIKRNSPDHADVKLIQAKLGVKIDGIFGPKTEEAVKDFQAKHHIAVDGIVGPVTWNKLFD